MLAASAQVRAHRNLIAPKRGWFLLDHENGFSLNQLREFVNNDVRNNRLELGFTYDMLF